MGRKLRKVGMAGMVLALALTVAACGSKPAAEPQQAQQSQQAQQAQPAAPAQPQASGGEDKSPIKIGAVFGLSGGIAAYGQSQRAGVELAVADINAAGGVLGRPIEVIFEDSQGKKEEAINAVRKLIDKDEVVAIIGPTLSAEMFAAGPVANDSGVPILGVSNTAKGITDIGEYVFRNSVPEAMVLPHTVKRSVETFGLKKVAVMYCANDDFSVSGYETFKAELEKNNVEILDIETFQTKDTDFKAQLTKIQSVQPDAIVISGLYQEAALILQQARQMGLNMPVIGGNGFNSPGLVSIAKEAAEGAVVGSPWFPGRDDPKTKAFVDAFTAKNGKGPDQFAAQAYDGLGLIVEAIKRAGSTDRDEVRDALAGIKDYQGVTGGFAFDENRNPVQTPYILQIKGGQYTELK